MSTDELRNHLAGLDALIARGFIPSHFQMTFILKSSDEQIEFFINRAGAGIVNQTNRNVYHTASNPELAYEHYRADMATKAKKGEKHQESAEMLAPILEALATRCFNNYTSPSAHNAYIPKIQDYIKDDGRNVVYRVWCQGGWRRIEVNHNKPLNKYRIFLSGVSRDAEYGKVSQSWIAPKSLIENLAKFAELKKALADPDLVVKKEGAWPASSEEE